MKAEKAWQAALGQLEMEMPKAAFDTWVRNTELLAYEDGSFTVGVRNAYARDWLDSRLSGKIIQILTNIMGRTCAARFIVWQNNGNYSNNNGDEDNVSELSGESKYSVDDVELTPRRADPVESKPAAEVHSTRTRLNTRYTFDSFVVGSSNRFAHAAALSVAEKPAQAFNPLFLYGGVGLGKTHLLQAIGNDCEKRGLSVLYVSSEEFTNDLVHAIRTQTTQAFRDKYRSIDVLLIDDIQFIAGKESTQEEFFHTFNTLHGQSKQIVVSSDRPPKALVTLEERLRSRFEWGLAADIQSPDYETRLAIIKAKADRAGYNIPLEIAELIARKVQSNIRELEGALTRIVAFANLSGLPLTAQLVESALADLLPRRKEIKPVHIVNAVADTFGVTVERLLGRDRTREIVLPRQIAMYLLREEAHCSLPQIGEALGGRDHTTIMHGCEKVTDMLERDDRLRKKVIEIRQNLFGVPSFSA
ncbi:MAG: chromosomal replication initiator protein DnaA [Chloroflexi bacterium]|nr:MAG: chromosomal replication initiator protein DnaA [Chloroflexota bacterium]